MFPKNIQIETTTVCAADCMMCPHKLVRRPSFMPMELIDKILNECSGHDVTIIPHQMGDPLADPRMMEILKICKNKDLKILMSTSGFLLDRARAEEMVRLGVDVINISLDSLDKKTYERVRKISFDKAMKNIHALIEIKRPPTKVWISAVDMFFNKKTRELFLNYWKGRVDEVQITPYVRYPKVYNWMLPRKKMKNLNFCQRVDTDMVILSNGEAAKCCIDFEGTTTFGNIGNETIDAIWNGRKRRSFIEKMRLEKRKKLYPCNICVI